MTELKPGVLKLLVFLKRKPGMTMDEFVERYENVHARVGEKVLRGSAIRYFRRYLFPTRARADRVEGDCDVVTEIWFPDRATYEQWLERAAAPEILDEIVQDELLQFDRSKKRHFIVQEYESTLD